MKKLILIMSVTFASPVLFASEAYYCSSAQTNFSYLFDIRNGTVEVSNEARGTVVGKAEVSYEPGTGEDILFVIKQGDAEYGIINGEEGIRANFSHSIFDSNVEDQGLECVPSRKPILKNISCELDSYRLEINYTAPQADQAEPVSKALYTLYKDGQALNPVQNEAELIQEGYEDTFLVAYLWAFASEDLSFGVALQGPRDLAPGVYDTAKADLFVSVGEDTMYGSTVSCVVEID